MLEKEQALRLAMGMAVVLSVWALVSVLMLAWGLVAALALLFEKGSE